MIKMDGIISSMNRRSVHSDLASNNLMNFRNFFERFFVLVDDAKISIW